MDPLQQLIKALSKLPGVGRRSAERMAVFLARDARGVGRVLALALQAVEEQVVVCARCGALTEKGRDPCGLCTAPDREDGQLCVVEDPGDIAILERARAFRGRYHALLGRIAPGQHQTVPHERLLALVHRVKHDGVSEVILALNTDVESEATASYIREVLGGLPVKITRLGLGIPVGSGIAWADPVTLSRALSGRQPMADPPGGEQGGGDR